MSIEKNIERIADALEGLLAVAQGSSAPAQNKRAEKPASVTAPVSTPPPEDRIPGVDDAPVVEATGEITTGAELRDLAQKYIQAAGEQTGVLVAFIQSVAKIYNPKEPKLIKIPVTKVGEAAAMIKNWCDKKHITLPIEV